MTQTTEASARDALVHARRLVVKIGSRVLASLEAGVDAARIDTLADEVAALRKEGREVILVSSGAVAAGAARLGMTDRPTSLSEQQAAAAVGQGKLMRTYALAFGRHDIPVGQMLLTRDGLDDRLRYLNARNTLDALLELGAVPIINENDTVAVEEIQFGDNDTLSALVAVMAEADALCILSDVDGLHEKPPAEGESAIISVVKTITPEVERRAGVVEGGIGKGGMASKLSAARRAGEAGVVTVIASGSRADALAVLCRGEAIGTCFAAEALPSSARKQWLAGRQPSGCIRVDVGARRALVEEGRSLLAIGMVTADEGIAVGDTVRIVDEAGTEFARGISNFDSDDLRRIAKCKSDELPSLLGHACPGTVIHRDHLVLTQGEVRQDS